MFNRTPLIITKRTLVAILTISGCVSLAARGDADPSSPAAAISRSVAEWNKDNSRLNNQLNTLEKEIGDIYNPVTFSVLKKGSGVKLAAIELWEGERLLKSHSFSGAENIALETGGRHEFDRVGITSGVRELKCVFYWRREAGEPKREEVPIRLPVLKGRPAMIELSIIAQRDSAEMRYSMIDLKK